MNEGSGKPVTVLLKQWRQGDEQALQRLIPLVYDELRRLAFRKMQGERPGHTLTPTALVHEAYGRLVQLELDFNDRAHFFRLAATTMRRVLVDHARTRQANKRGAGAPLVTLDELHTPGDNPAEDLLALDAALTRLTARFARQAEMIELHYFGGMTYEEIAAACGVARPTVSRDLRLARAWLRRELAGR